MKTFKDLGLNEDITSAISKSGFKTPTLIQERTIPLIIQHKDVIGESSTGSGKTLAFGCGLLQNITYKKGLQSLILTPTRELAEQIKKELLKLSSKMKVSAVYGGVAIDPQVRELKNSEVVVGTPGRLLDHLQRRTIDTSKIKLIVLDEADRMLDMGFIESVEKILRSCPRERQTLFFSATISPKIKRLAKKYMKDHLIITAEKQVDPEKLEQVYYNIERNWKLSLLTHLLKEEKSKQIMVFCNTRHTTNFVTTNLRKNDLKATAIHGGLTQKVRNDTIKAFKELKVQILVCTDVAARGIHIDNVSHIYNYEIPKDPKDYIHRIGRTARAGEEGKVINLLAKEDHDNFSRIQRDSSNMEITSLDTPRLKRIKISTVKDPNQRRRRFSHTRKFDPSKTRKKFRGSFKKR